MATRVYGSNIDHMAIGSGQALEGDARAVH